MRAVRLVERSNMPVQGAVLTFFTRATVCGSTSSYPSRLREARVSSYVWALRESRDPWPIPLRHRNGSVLGLHRRSSRGRTRQERPQRVTTTPAAASSEVRRRTANRPGEAHRHAQPSPDEVHLSVRESTLPGRWPLVLGRVSRTCPVSTTAPSVSCSLESNQGSSARECAPLGPGLAAGRSRHLGQGGCGPLVAASRSTRLPPTRGQLSHVAEAAPTAPTPPRAELAHLGRRAP